ncbi:ATP-binding protein [Jatrophihabitans fulvus]
MAPTEREFSGDPYAPAEARAFVIASLGTELGAPVTFPVRDDIELVVSELVTNAVRAGSASVRVAVEVTGRRAALRVADDAPGWPQQRAASIHDVSGRGLALVAAISAAWGVRLTGETGKIVWAEIELDGTS